MPGSGIFYEVAPVCILVEDSPKSLFSPFRDWGIGSWQLQSFGLEMVGADHFLTIYIVPSATLSMRGYEPREDLF